MKAIAVAVAAVLPLAALSTAAPASAKADRGSLKVIAQNVPAGNSAKITLARKGYRKKVPSSGRVRNLSPGTYRVWASPIVVNGGTASVPNLPLKVKVKKRARSTLQLSYLWSPRTDFYPPNPAQSLQVTARSASSIQLSWKNGTSPDLQSVSVRRKLGRDAPVALDEGDVVPASQLATSVRDTDVAAGTTYSYSVFMVDDVGNASAPVSITTRTLARAEAVTAGLSHTCALVGDPTPAKGGDQIVCWGDDTYGQLGDAAGSSSAIPLNVAVPSPTKVVSGGDHSCALTTEADVWCWGRNDDGQLGAGDTRAHSGPVRVKLSAVQDVAVGTAHTCVVMQSGAVKCWGANTDGQVGDEASSRVLRPVTVAGIDDAEQVVAGYAHSCVLLNAGLVQCWGDNEHGQLGDGSGISSHDPVSTGLSNVRDLSAGVNHTCAAVSNDRLRCWGGNTFGQLGDGTTVDRDAPVETSVRDAGAVSAGAYHTCAVADGRARCWGRNNSGRLGDGTTTDRSQPTRVSGLGTVEVIAAGGYHSCAVADARAYCWGANGAGQLGDGSRTGSLTPVAVDGL